jgi:alkanesulfonate monooxygenase SsuD/methylene tetrahydromethanopterin reductase-like flavin-dependent oxidoreductase (luciferase family)
MKFAIDIPNFGAFADPHLTAQVAREAEAAGWDAVWVWDHVWRDEGVPYADPWILMAAIALATTRIRFGPMVVPLPRRRPWIVAREAVTLDHLSGGRFTLGVGLGAPIKEFAAFGEEPDLKIRAAKLDEALEIIGRCWSGDRFSFRGDHYSLDDVQFLPVPVQPRIPIWAAATWPVRAPFRRAARLDGIWPLRRDEDGKASALGPGDVRDIAALIGELRTSPDPYDILIHGITPADDPAAAAETVAAVADAGATWWTERINPIRGTFENMRDRILAGPPRL